MESLSVSGDTKVGIQGAGLNSGGRGRLGVVLRDGVRMRNGFCARPLNLVGTAWPQYKDENNKEVTTDFTLGDCNKKNVADLLCLYVSTTQVENTLLCIWF